MEKLDENIEIKTFRDGEIHRYFTSIEIDKSMEDCMGTATLKCPYDHELFGYWKPIIHIVGIRGGTYDNEWMFIGRTRAVKRDGYELEVKLQDEGWKLKTQCPDDLYQKWKDNGSNFETVMSDISEVLNLDYVILQDVNDIALRTSFDKDGNIVRDSKKIEEIPDPIEIIKKINTLDDYHTKSSSGGYNQKMMKLLFSFSDEIPELYEEYFNKLVREAQDELFKQESNIKITGESNATVSNVVQAVTSLSKKLSKANGYYHAFGCSSASCIASGKRGDCFAMSDYIYEKLSDNGIICKIVQYSTSVASNHRSVMYKKTKNGSWIDFPYSGFDTNFKSTSGSKSSKNVIKCSLGSGKCN